MSQINATVRLYNHVNKDTADHIITAYRSGTFYQIRDIYNLRAKITQSHHYASIDTERVFLQLLTEVNSQAEALLVLNEMDLLLLCISSAVLVAEDPGNAPLLPSLEAQISSLTLHLDACREACSSVEVSRLPRPQEPDTTRFLPYFRSEQLEVLIPLLQLIQCLTKSTSSTENCQTHLTPLPSLLSRLGESLPVEECGANLRARGSMMELLVFRVETLGLVAVLLAAIAQIFGVGGNKTGKKGKKGKATAKP